MKRVWIVLCLITATVQAQEEKLPRRVAGSPVVISGQYFCYLIGQSPDHVYCRYCETCRPVRPRMTIPFDYYLPRPQ